MTNRAIEKDLQSTAMESEEHCFKHILDVFCLFVFLGKLLVVPLGIMWLVFQL